MPTVVVLGMHRSGTSLVAQMLDAMGVDMGVDKSVNQSGVFGAHWEDPDFLLLNEHILMDTGGSWDEPQPLNWDRNYPECALLATTKARPELVGGEPRQPGDWWGWKDPRTCLTIGAYHQYLDNPHYIVIDRDWAAVEASLSWRDGKDGDHWRSLALLYSQERETFLTTVRPPELWLTYEDIIADPEGNARAIATFLGIDPLDAAAVVRPQSLEIPTEYIVTLGDATVQHKRAETRTVSAPETGTGYEDIKGPIHGLVSTNGSDPETVRGWAAKVRPGGYALGVLDDMHDWPRTTWSKTTQAYSPSYMQRRPFLQAGDGWGTFGIGVPYFKASYEFWRWFSWLLLEGLQPGDLLLNDESVNAPEPIPTIFNRLIARFLETDRDTMVFIEDDHVATTDILQRMRDKPANRGFDIVTANYVNRRADPLIVGYELPPTPNRFGEYTVVIDQGDVWKTGTQPVGGSAMGICMIRRWVLDAMLDGRNPEYEQFVRWHGRNSQDIQFYARARDVGARVGVDRDANIEHLSQKAMKVQDFWAMREGAKGMENVNTNESGF